ncbi:hypothetical protein MPSEU_000119700 [Mayamaea pseudoterrestris]|nr:hypothetical protein MPSEU_000119700 [Mayamaea pseudoterrestris]
MQDSHWLVDSCLHQLKTKVDMDVISSSTDNVMTDESEEMIQPIAVKYSAHAERVTNNAFSFYSSAFVFAGSKAELATTSLNEIRVAAVILYNLALCFHVHGISRAASESYFSKALQLYQTALGLLEEMASVSQTLVDKDSLLMLALYNNIGHIYSCDHKTAETQACLDIIQSILAKNSTLEGSNDDWYKANTLRESQYLEFHLNVVILHGTRRHPPAA